MKPLMVTCDLLDEVHATQVGRSIEVRPGEAPETVIRVAGPDQRTQMLTATMGIEQVPPGVGTRAVTALIRWGAGGAQLLAEADWLQGAVVSVPASYLEILARCDGTNPARVSAAMGYGPRACGCETLFKTVSYGTLTFGAMPPAVAFRSLPVPAWATTAIVLFQSSVTLEAEVEELEIGDVIYDVPAPVGVGTALHLPNGAGNVRLTATAGASGKAFIRYALAL
jgi:hypothetical protein